MAWLNARSWMRLVAGEPLPAQLEEELTASLTSINRRRLRWFVPIMLALHAAHAMHFFVDAAERVALDARTLAWRDGLVLTHVITALAIALVALATLPRRSPLGRFSGPLAAVIYLLHGAVIVGVDLLVVQSSTVFLGYALAIAVVVALRPLALLLVYGLGAAAYVAVVQVVADDAFVRAANTPPGVSVSLVAFAMGLFFHFGRRRDLGQRAIIDHQREELRALNASLEDRVDRQVSEIVARAEEIEALNKQLRASVQERSSELSFALAKLSLQRDAGLAEGTVFGERFVIERFLGEGGMGVVYAALDRSTEQHVALKIIQASSARELDGLRRFLREAETVAAVEHPAVVRMLHVDVTADGVLFQAQELVRGTTLQGRLHGGPLAAPTVARVGAVLCDALHAAHAAGVIHRDVKPANIMLTHEEPGLKLLDFGIAKLYDAVTDDVTKTGLHVGTPSFMAPEQVAGSADDTDRVDVYAVGVVLFSLLTGRLPFDDKTAKDRLLRRTIEDAPPLLGLVPDLDPALAAIVGDCLVRDPARRPSAQSAAEALRIWADSREIPALPVLNREDNVAAIASDPHATKRMPTPGITEG